MPTRNPFPFVKALHIGEPWLTHTLANALHAYRQQLETELQATADPKGRFDLRLALCETRAAQEQLLANTLDEIGREAMRDDC